MQTVAQNTLFTDISSEEAANINGAYGYYYYYPDYYCYPVYYRSYAPSYGGGSSGSNSSVTQTTNVNVLIED
jgi:hypothetical protein